MTNKILLIILFPLFVLMQMKGITSIVLLFNAIGSFAQQPNEKAYRNECYFINGCNDPQVCCKMVPSNGTVCADMSYTDGEGKRIPKCPPNTPLMPPPEGCVVCQDIVVQFTQGIGIGQYARDGFDLHVRIRGNNTIYYENGPYCNSDSIMTLEGRFPIDKEFSVWTTYNPANDELVIHSSLHTDTMPFYDSSQVYHDTFNMDSLCDMSAMKAVVYALYAKNFENSNFKISPNPTTGKVAFQLTPYDYMIYVAQNINLKLYDFSGKLIYDQNIKASKNYEVDLSKIAKSGQVIVYKLQWGDIAGKEGKIVFEKE